MKRTTSTVIAAAMLVFARMSPAAVPAAAEPAPSVSVMNGETVVTAGQKTQAASGIEVQALTLDSRRGETTAYGTVVDLQPLIDLRTRYRSAQTEAMVARTTLKASEQQYQRVRTLNQLDKNASDRALQAAQAAWETDRAKASAVALLADDVRALASARWGRALAEQVLDGGAKALAKLLSGQEVLLELAFPSGVSAPASVEIDVADANGKPLSAQWVAASPRADLLTRNPTFFYRAAATTLRAGWRVAARVPLGGDAAEGVFVPESAVIWHANQPWAYVRTDATHFVRRPLASARAVAGGWFATQGWRGGEQVVVAGAQLLFSEEFKPRQPAGGKTTTESADD
jgi:membrane fusion protein, multidrug efflux system